MRSSTLRLKLSPISCNSCVIVPSNPSATPHSVVKNTYAPEAALVDVSVDGSRRDKVDDSDCFTLLTITVYTPNTLFDPHRIPRQVIVDK